MLMPSRSRRGRPVFGLVRTMPRKKRPTLTAGAAKALDEARDAAPAGQSEAKADVGKTAHAGAATKPTIARPRRKRKITEADVRGLKYFALIDGLLSRLHGCATERDKAGNRILHFDQYCALVLLFYFNPIVGSLRGIQEASQLKKIQKRLGCARASLGSLSEAAQVFDPELLRQMIPELAAKILPTARGKDASALRNLIAVDGSLLPALPKMVWALWRDKDHRAAKMHVHFDVFKGVPEDVTVTQGNGSEREQLRKMLQPRRIYVTDRGYEDYQLLQDIVDACSSSIARLQDDPAYQPSEERPLTKEDKAAGVVRDVILKRLGTAHHKNVLKHPVRLVFVQTDKLDSTGKPNVLVLVTNLLDLPAELVAIGYKHRWAVELFFRWLKCILGCRHLLANSQNGVEIQVYLGMIASLLISLWTGRKPTTRTLEMVQFYFCGWATWGELQAHIQKLNKHDEKLRKQD
jgi:Transposase DDE domain